MDASAGTVSPVNIPGWRDFPLVERVARGHRRAARQLVGDGVAITAAEHWQGAARGHDNALCMVVSTGVGGGLVLNGTAAPGPTGNAGHIGHISVDLDGDLCPCGARGCVERIASGPNIARRALANGWQPGPDGDTTAAAVAAAAARAGDPVAVASFERAAQALAAGIAATATLVEIEIAVIGGGVAGAGEVLFAPLRRALRDYATLSFVQRLTVVPAQMGTDAGLVGAAPPRRSSCGSRVSARTDTPLSGGSIRRIGDGAAVVGAAPAVGGPAPAPPRSPGQHPVEPGPVDAVRLTALFDGVCGGLVGGERGPGVSRPRRSLVRVTFRRAPGAHPRRPVRRGGRSRPAYAPGTPQRAGRPPSRRVSRADVVIHKGVAVGQLSPVVPACPLRWSGRGAYAAGRAEQGTRPVPSGDMGRDLTGRLLGRRYRVTGQLGCGGIEVVLQGR